MSFATALQDAEKAIQGVLSFFTNVNTICDILQSGSDKRPLHSNSYLDYATIRDSILSKGVTNVDRLQSAVNRVNVATFTTAVWLDNVQYDEAISIFFPLLIPKQLHTRDDVIDLFLTTVTRWAIAETRWPTGIHTTDDVISKVKQRIDKELERKGPLLSQRIWNAFKARFEQLDSTPLWNLQNMVNGNRMKETWFKALPMVLEAIDRKDGYGHTLRHCPTQDHRCETQAGMKRSHNQQADPVDKRHRRQPIVVSAISDEEDVESQDEDTRDNSSNEDEYYDALDTWDEENGSNVYNLNMKGTSLSSHGVNGLPPPPPPYHLQERHDTSYNTIVRIPPFFGDSAPNNNNHHDGQIPHLNSEYGGQHMNGRIENDDPTRSELPYVTDTIDLRYPSSTMLHFDSNQPTPPSDDPQLLASISNTWQQNDQANNQSSVTAAPETPRSRKNGKRSYRPWTKEEITTLEEGLRLYGKNWAKIKENDIFHSRTKEQVSAIARSIAARRRRQNVPLGAFACM